jgi:hypothetical protein
MSLAMLASLLASSTIIVPSILYLRFTLPPYPLFYTIMYLALATYPLRYVLPSKGVRVVPPNAKSNLHYKYTMTLG